MELLTLEFWARMTGIMLLNLMLSGDNALVIAMAVRMLPRRQRLLGQIWGAVGAVVLRLLFVGIVSWLLRIPLLRLAGGLLLFWIAIRLVYPGSEEDGGEIRHGASLWEAIWIIVVADVTMSLDNVLAIAATAGGDMLLVIVGVGLSLPIVIWGAGLLAVLMNRWVFIVWVGGGVLGYVAAEMVLEDPVVRRGLGGMADILKYPVSASIGVLVVALGWWFARTRGRRSKAAQPRARDFGGTA